MNKYVIVDGKPYLFADGRAYSVRRNEEGFTVGKAVELTEIPTRTYSELSINAKFPSGFDSIGVDNENTPDETDEADAFEAVSEEAIDGVGGLTADADDIVLVRDGKDIVIPDETDETDEADALDKLSVAELREYAKEHGYGLKGARTKPEILEAIHNAHEDETAEK